MTLKELRISKGLTQRECAEYLGVSLRSYQTYESEESKLYSRSYNSLFAKLEAYGSSNPQPSVAFNMSVITGEKLDALTSSVARFEKRTCYKTLSAYLNEDNYGNVLVLYGLRRTGKTTMILQAIRELPSDKTAYIKASLGEDMMSLTKDLNTLQTMGIKYVFIDEVTLLEDFIDTSATLSDIYAMMGMKIILSGTDSLGFIHANRDELYDRSIMIHTSYFPFKEYSRLLKIDDIDTYIEYGGTLMKENMFFGDKDQTRDDVSARFDEKTRKYIDSAISRNIQHTLRNDRFGDYFNELRGLYEAGELTNVINRIVENVNHRFVLKVIEDKFKSSDFGSSKNLLAHDIPRPVGYALGEVDYDAIIKRLKKLVDIKDKEERTIGVKDEHIRKIKKYLLTLDLIDKTNIIYESGAREDYYVFLQPGMRYSIAKALSYSLMQDEYFISMSKADQNYIVEKILGDVKGRMLEDIVLYETTNLTPTYKTVFKFKFDRGGEFDMVVYDKYANTCDIYEIKHSDKINEKQIGHLIDQEKLMSLERLFGKVVSKNVLYRGEEANVDGINYINVEHYLKSL